jgi:hypothetical protein
MSFEGGPMQTRLRWLLLLLTACGTDPRDDAPETTTELPPSTAVVSDAAAAVVDAQGIDAARVDCTNDGLGCDDAVFCNGIERCEPGAVGADARGCARGPALGCEGGQTCSEQKRACSPCSDTALDDADGDGHEAASCGGDDCSDDDLATHPGAPELCNARDDDCDGVVDGAAASAACMASAPPMSTSLCGAGACEITCSDPDADLVGGACVQHDDCAGVTACAPGSCIDGVRSYTCSCPTGYQGTTACTDVDECASTNDCDDSPAACVNDPGAYHCACPDTHRGEGKGAHGCTRKATAIAAGVGHTCALLRGGRVKCWGRNDFGQLGVTAAGLGDALPYVPLRTTAVAIAVGSDLSCAVLSDGAAKCWGYAQYGATGDSTSPNGLSMFDAPLPRSATQLATGSGYGYALLDDRSIGRWGAAFAAYPIAPGRKVKAFDRSPLYDGYHLCALLDNGVVTCWPGYSYYSDSYGTLGPNYNDALPPESRPVIAFGSGQLTTQIATGSQHSCALLDSGAIKCWGRNDFGQLGIGDAVHRGVSVDQMGDALPALNLGGATKAIAAGQHHSCALLSDGKITCWGLNDAGQLGRGDTVNVGDTPNPSFSAVELGSHSAVAIELGAHSCALLDDGAVKCWGTNTNGELGQGDTAPRGATPGTMGDALLPIDLGE